MTSSGAKQIIETSRHVLVVAYGAVGLVARRAGDVQVVERALNVTGKSLAGPLGPPWPFLGGGPPKNGFVKRAVGA
jgi:hypothetical protein